MKFIFPQNYYINTKILGILDYPVAIFDVIWGGLIIIIINFFIRKIIYKIFAFIILVFPIIIFSIVGVDGENFLYFLLYIFKYFLKQKIYLYDKRH